MGTTGSHLPCFVPKDSAQGQVLLYHVSLHTNNHCDEKRGVGKNLLLTVRTVMLQEQVDMVAGDFTGAAWRRQPGSGLRKPSPTRVNPFRLVDQEACQVSGRMYVGS